MDWIVKNNVSIYNEKNGKGLIRHLSVRSSSDGKRATVCLSVNGQNIPAEKELISSLPFAESVLLDINLKKGNSVMGGQLRVLSGGGFLTDTLMGLKFRVSPASFYQVNHDQTEVLYQKALDLAEIKPAETVLDLYCGIGTITLCLAKNAKKAIGAEIVPEAFKNAVENAKLNGVENVEFICADAYEASKQIPKADVVTVDPPRKGLSPDVMDSIVKIAPSRIVYISCDCATLARDLKFFNENGYKTKAVKAVDMFPKTRHVETIIMMTCDS